MQAADFVVFAMKGSQPRMNRKTRAAVSSPQYAR
jgi:hypothetical protein